MRVFIGILLLTVSFVTHAVDAKEATAASKINFIVSYNDFNGVADIGFSIAGIDGNSVCKGFWLKEDDPGFNLNMSLLTAAYHAKNDVQVVGYVGTTFKWAAKGAHYCRLYSISYPY